MAKKKNDSIYWAPRILSICFILFLCLFSLDMISPELTLQQILIGLFMHNIPVFILTAVLIISWKYEIVGGIIFILAGLVYAINMLTHALRAGPEGFPLAPVLLIAGPAFVIGFLFLRAWLRKRRK